MSKTSVSASGFASISLQSNVIHCSQSIQRCKVPIGDGFVVDVEEAVEQAECVGFAEADLSWVSREQVLLVAVDEQFLFDYLWRDYHLQPQGIALLPIFCRAIEGEGIQQETKN